MPVVSQVENAESLNLKLGLASLLAPPGNKISHKCILHKFKCIFRVRTLKISFESSFILLISCYNALAMPNWHFL